MWGKKRVRRVHIPLKTHQSGAHRGCVPGYVERNESTVELVQQKPFG